MRATGAGPDDIPDADMPIAAAAGHQAAVGREGKRFDGGVGNVNGGELLGLLAAAVPEPDDAIERAGAGSEGLMVGGEGEGIDVAGMGVRHPAVAGFVAAQVPEPQAAVHAARCQRRPVRRKGDRRDRSAMPLQAGRLSAAWLTPGGSSISCFGGLTSGGGMYGILMGGGVGLLAGAGVAAAVVRSRSPSCHGRPAPGPDHPASGSDLAASLASSFLTMAATAGGTSGRTSSIGSRPSVVWCIISFLMSGYSANGARPVSKK